MGRLFATSVGTGGACETKGSTIGPDGQQRENCNGVVESCTTKVMSTKSDFAPVRSDHPRSSG
eukprot:1183212-Prorocentrum_minimum.AAC.2